MKIFITGITGFVGGSVANYFASLGHEVVGIGRSDRLPPHVSGNCSYVKADMLEPLADIHADIVVHAAGLASHTASFEELYDTNVRGDDQCAGCSQKCQPYYTHFFLFCL